MNKALQNKIAKEMREKFFGTGYAGRDHEPWEAIGDRRQAKWLSLVTIADEMLQGIHTRRAARKVKLAKETP